MPTAEEAHLEQLNARHRAKLAARIDGSAPTFQTEPIVDLSGRTPEAVEARYREKLLRHGKPAPAPAEPKKAKAEPKAEPKAEQPAPAPAEPEKVRGDHREPKRGG